MKDDWLRQQREALDANERRIAELKHRVMPKTDTTPPVTLHPGITGRSSPFPRQFSLLHLMLLLTISGIVLSASQYSLLAVLFLCPGLFGGLTGHWRSGSRRGAILGAECAYLTSLVWGGGLGIVIMWAIPSAKSWPPEGSDHWQLLASIVVTSVIGGYFGGGQANTSMAAEPSRRLANGADCELE